MTRSNRRALEAARTITSARGAAVPPINYVWAALLENDPKRRKAALEDAGRRIAEADDPEAAFLEVWNAFFTKPPRPALDADDEPTGSGAESMRRRRFAKADPDSAPAPAAVPGARDDDDGRKIGPIDADDDRLSIEDMDAALTALETAVHFAFPLAPLIGAGVAAISSIASSSRDENTRMAVQRFADRCRDCERAAGTRAEERRAQPAYMAAQSAIENAVARGADVSECEAINRACREWEDLRERGLVRMSRERYVDIAMERFKRETAQ